MRDDEKSLDPGACIGHDADISAVPGGLRPDDLATSPRSEHGTGAGAIEERQTGDDLAHEGGRHGTFEARMTGRADESRQSGGVNDQASPNAGSSRGGQEPGVTPESASHGRPGRNVTGGTTGEGAARGRGVDVSFSPDGGGDEQNLAQSDLYGVPPGASGPARGPDEE